ncbi:MULTISPECIES: TNT domain-containing protein [Streptomycetaceae]|uniref:TNT domain-containing protein n=1 Tax=Streptomycetaceae TaxID=2062 RepID=UPI000378434E|nr:MULTISPECIES: TNT domain-containing protein [Streptomycetaceae]
MKRRQRISLSTLPALFVLLVGTLLGTVTSAHAEDWGPGAQLAAPHGRPEAGHGPGPVVGAPGRPPGGPENPRICLGAVFTAPKFFCGDPRLGPRELPTKGLLGTILAGYRRLDGQNANGFLGTWWNFTTNSYKFPDPVTNPDGFRTGFTPVPLTLSVGQRIDRFGNEGGRFLAPAGSPFSQRSIPPSNLNTFDAGYPFNYHLYKVVKPFTVASGPAEPWFGQPGNGLQYVLPAGDNVANHVANGDLIRLN